jgi:putative sterol carrier protein
MTEAAKFFSEELPAKDHSKTKGMNATYKFDITDAGKWVVTVSDGTVSVQEGDGDAQCTVVVSAADFDQLTDGKLNPQMAFMTGKLKIQGDMGLAMKLQAVL